MINTKIVWNYCFEQILLNDQENTFNNRISCFSYV